MSFRCPDCGKELSTESGKDSHRSQVHDWSRMVEVTCEQCGDTFERKRSVQEQSDSTICSEECNHAFQSEQYSGEQSHEWNGGPKEDTCPVCGEVFNHRNKQQTCCSRDCADELRDWPSGEDHPRWNPERDWWPYYGANWSEQREKARNRDGACQICGLTSQAYRCLHGKALDVHHITPFKEYDEHEEAKRLENLMTLCASCHNIVERGLQ